MGERGPSLRAVFLVVALVVATAGLVVASCARVHRESRLPASMAAAGPDSFVGAETCKAWDLTLWAFLLMGSRAVPNGPGPAD